jgi:hypothetical protein
VVDQVESFHHVGFFAFGGTGNFQAIERMLMDNSASIMHIEAECKNGVLTVHLPKAASAKPKQVKVK